MLRRLRARGGDRLVVGADDRRPGGARGALRLRPAGPCPARRQPPLLRPDRAPLPGRPPGDRASRSASSCATSSCRATAATACWAPAGAASCGSASGRPRLRAELRAELRGSRRARAPSRSRVCAASASSWRTSCRCWPRRNARSRRRRRGGRSQRPSDDAAPPGCKLPRSARPADVGPRGARAALRLRIPLGGLHARGEAPLGLLRPADTLRRSAWWAASSRASTGPSKRCGSSAWPGSPASIRSKRPVSLRRSPRRWTPTSSSAAPARSCRPRAQRTEPSSGKSQAPSPSGTPRHRRRRADRPERPPAPELLGRPVARSPQPSVDRDFSGVRTSPYRAAIHKAAQSGGVRHGRSSSGQRWDGMATWRRARVARRRHERRIHRSAGDVGFPDRASRRQDQPGGAAGRGACHLLLDGSFERPRKSGIAAGEPRSLGRSRRPNESTANGRSFRAG